LACSSDEQLKQAGERAADLPVRVGY